MNRQRMLICNLFNLSPLTPRSLHKIYLSYVPHDVESWKTYEKWNKKVFIQQWIIRCMRRNRSSRCKGF